MIKAKQLPLPLFWFFLEFIFLILKIRLRAIKIQPIEIRENCSYIFMSNHFSFMDGFIALYVIKQIFVKDKNVFKKFFAITLEQQILKNKWLTLIGAFSINPSSRKSIKESLDYAAHSLENSGNVLLLFPQGRIESNHVDFIDVKPGLAEIVKKTTNNCQLIWSSNLIDYFESGKPTVFCHLLDCGMTSDFNLELFRNRVNGHHNNAIQRQIRVPKG